MKDKPIAGFCIIDWLQHFRRKTFLVCEDGFVFSQFPTKLVDYGEKLVCVSLDCTFTLLELLKLALKVNQEIGMLVVF